MLCAYLTYPLLQVNGNRSVNLVNSAAQAVRLSTVYFSYCFCPLRSCTRFQEYIKLHDYYMVHVVCLSFPRRKINFCNSLV